jgi:hypothetical protein
VALARSRSDVQIYTNDRIQLPDTLGREHAHASVLERSMGPGLGGSDTPVTQKPTQRIEHGIGYSR